MDTRKQEGIGNLFGNIFNHLSALLRSEIDLTRAEIDQNLRRAATAVGLILAAAILFLTALNVLAAALSAGLAELGLEPGWAALIVGVSFAVIGWVLMAKGLHDLKLSRLAPTRAAENVKRDARAVRGE